MSGGNDTILLDHGSGGKITADLIAGTLLFFIPATGDYINAELLGTPNEYMIGNVIDALFLRVLDYPRAAALSITLMVVVVGLVTVYVRRAGTEELV